MNIPRYSGSHHDLGKAMGRELAPGIAHNIRYLVRREGCPPLPVDNPAFIAWVRSREKRLERDWPWLLEEMAGVAEGSGESFRDILYLNLRVWQFDYYGGPLNHCSNVAMRLAEGDVALGGALDDDPQWYRGLAVLAPAGKAALVGWGITGTSWATRGVSSAGLAIGTASMLTPGLPLHEGHMNQDLAIRIILQECRTVADVRAFCAAVPFSVNLVAVDSANNVLAVHQTTAGTHVVATEAPVALTNHVIDDRVVAALVARGYVPPAMSGPPTTQARRGQLLDFATVQAGKATREDLQRHLAVCNDSPGCVCPAMNLCLTCAVPAAAPGVLWTASPRRGQPEWVEVRP